MTVAELKDKIEGMPPDAVVTFGTNINDVIIAVAVVALMALIVLRGRK